MSKLNVKVPHPKEYTHEGALAARINPEQQLRRSVLSCLLWEDEFYEDGTEIAQRIVELVSQVKPAKVAALAAEARIKFNLRHVPLLLISALAKTGGLKDPRDFSGYAAVSAVIRRADELAELLAVHAKVNGTNAGSIKKFIPKQMKRGLAEAFKHFDEYQLAKYDRAGAIRLRDVLRLVHPKPDNEKQGALWKRLLDNELKTPDTWEVALSGGADKKATFTRFLTEGVKSENGKTYPWGYMALVRNLRNMDKAGVDPALINEAIIARKGGADKLFPFRFISAAKAAPMFEEALDTAMLANLAQMPKLKGKTVIIVDVSGSMGAAMSVKSDMHRAHSACAIATIAREMCEKSAIYATAGNDSYRTHQTKRVPSRHGIALVDAIWSMSIPLGRGGIFLKQVMDFVGDEEKTADRVIVLTDEQDCDNSALGAPAKARLFAPRNYMCNVSGHRNGIGYGRWTHIDGFSESVLRYIAAVESEKEDIVSQNMAAMG